CAQYLQGFGFDVHAESRGERALDSLRRRCFDILVVDLYLPGSSGMDILTDAIERYPHSKVILMTGNPSVESSHRALEAGAFDFLPKPFSATHLEILVDRAVQSIEDDRAAEPDVPSVEPRKPRASTPADAIVEQVGDYGLLAESKALRNVIDLARRVARTDASVFITGESGTGKELIAHFIHANSRRKVDPWVPVNCAAIPESLMESEMFGHVEGAFTGASRAKEGLLETAHGGSLFLDELAEMPMSIQAKLLRVLQDGVVRRVGSTRTDATVDARFIAATNRDPHQAIEEQLLRKDLYYRLRVVPIHIPPLRERPEDIRYLSAYYLRHFWTRHRPDEDIPQLTDGARAFLVSHTWPGNVRELRNVIEHAVVVADPGAHIAPSAFDLDGAGEWGNAVDGGFGIDRSLFRKDYHTAREEMLAAFERDYLAYILQESDGNMSGAARLAGVDRTTLYRIMEKRNLRRRDLLEA
ncbi:MAG: sigma-54-dependent Fis family transcriptional regulator, partial [Gemmatimonadetes bacterium]|nr:sigma-54-dependent Fis family transcriptional regulator [Gemmatimonadota bacterium]